MDTEVTVAIVTGIFLTISTVFSGITAYLTKRTTNTFDRKSEDLKESFEKTSRLIITDGERETVAKLIQLTLEEEAIVRVTRFNPRKIQRRERYYQAMQARIAGSIFEGDHYKRLEKYCRLTSFNSRENKESLIEMINEFKGGKCKNLILRVTSDKNDYEILIFEKSKVAALCFHDVMNQDVVHSCMIVREGRLFDNFCKLYEKVWNRDILMEIDFSNGQNYVDKQVEQLKSMEPIEALTKERSDIDSIVRESNLRIKACETMLKK